MLDYAFIKMHLLKQLCYKYQTHSSMKLSKGNSKLSLTISFLELSENLLDVFCF